MDNIVLGIQDRLDELKRQRKELQVKLEFAAPNEAEQIRFELAAVEEDIIAARREVKQFIPNHNVGRAGRKRALEVGGLADRVAFRAWERAGEVVEHASDVDKMRHALLDAKRILGKNQRAVLDAVGQHGDQMRLAKAKGVSASTINRTLQRAQSNLTEMARLIYDSQARMDVTEDGMRQVNLSDLVQLKNVLSLLTVTQQAYFLLHSAGLSATEIGALMGAHRSTVSRTVCRAKARLNVLAGTEKVEICGAEPIKELLISRLRTPQPDVEVMGLVKQLSDSLGIKRIKNLPGLHK